MTSVTAPKNGPSCFKVIKNITVSLITALMLSPYLTSLYIFCEQVHLNVMDAWSQKPATNAAFIWLFQWQIWYSKDAGGCWFYITAIRSILVAGWWEEVWGFNGSKIKESTAKPSGRLFCESIQPHICDWRLWDKGTEPIWCPVLANCSILK